MKSIVELDVELPRERVATLFADPENSTAWMHDLAKYEPISGQLGAQGFKYRLTPKKGDMVFVATVISNDLPNATSVDLRAARVSVAVTARFIAISPSRSRLVSVEVFTFKGVVGKIMGLFAGGAIRKAHREHMESFKRFAERRGRADTA